MLPATTMRVPLHTPQRYNETIRRQTEQNIARAAAGGPEAIEHRLRELDQEWDMERALETNASIVALIGLGLGAFVDRRFNGLPALVCGFLLQHALQGWCPPVPLLRHLGIRTASEIDHERYALKALRGDFRSLSDSDGMMRSTDEALAAAER
jgi:hypothetical protein